MNVRHKYTGEVREVIDSTDKFFIAHPCHDITLALPKTNWEPVPTDTWRDVTAKCDVIPATCLIGNENGEVPLAKEGYRLRKVELYTEEALKFSLGYAPTYTKRTAFLIERKGS